MSLPAPVTYPAALCSAAAGWRPLPGSKAYVREQVRMDCATLVQVAACLRGTVGQITPLLQTLYFRAAPLAVLDCCATLEALAQEVEQDDVQTITERGREHLQVL
ncbi:hypothetical protein [Acetobacter persici]|uniref:hypothetical protein n=1 Tax=Acetobacter persici TaxID=1076596 RepID=UPI001F3DFC3C|nr:hypothetical protein [Acetobacter persici]MCG0998025.1 hypothetical protein [Acetobacter persici]